VSYSCAQVVSPETLLAADGFTTHSNFEKSTYSKYNTNCFCKETNWLVRISMLAGHLSKVVNIKLLRSAFLFNSYSLVVNALTSF